MKKITARWISLLLALVMAVSVTACGASSDHEGAAETDSAAEENTAGGQEAEGCSGGRREDCECRSDRQFRRGESLCS